MNKEMMRKEGPKLLGVALGAFVYAVGVNLFIVPSGLYTGGLSNRNLFSCSSASQQSKTKLWAGLVSPEASSWPVDD